MVEKRLEAVIDTVSFKESGEDSKNAFLDGANLHGYLLGDDLPEWWKCELCGARYSLSAMAIATTGAFAGQPVCLGDKLFVSTCPAYGFDLIRPALPDELPELWPSKT